MKKRFSWLILGACFVSGLYADPVPVTATTTMVADLVRQVGGDHVEVSQLMGAGVDPHSYKPTRADVRAMQQAKAIFYNGLHLEGRMTDVLVRMARRGMPVYAVTEAIPEEELLNPADYEGAHDPHVWFDPRLWAQTVPVVVEGLSAADPANAESYATQGEKVADEILALHTWALERVAALPVEKRILVTSHDAYNYFGRAYEFQVVGVQGLSTVSEAGLADPAKVAEFVRENAVKAIFVESSVSPRAIERISENSGTQVGGEIFSDAMGTPGDLHTMHGDTYDVGTYAGMVKHNLNTIVEALK